MKQKTSKITEKKKSEPKQDDASERQETASEETIINSVKENLKTIRHIKGFSLDKLAARCGVSRAMLSQIEQGKSAPTISVLWKIASGLNVPFSDLIKEKNAGGLHILKYENSKVLYSTTKVFTSRALFPFSGNRTSEFYELTLKPGGIEIAEAHQNGTTENIVVVQGVLRLRIGEKVVELQQRDSVFFRADVPHEYSNPSDTEAIMYLVMNYADEIN
ncbi:MAG TPA: XRE family transcriptional regulator [Leptospiraceae bacterium]|nr:XRE family transcriptional regulator [Leptospiraceae bacterium]HMZ61351.1 XRE family transcriptional regulator [Leptospiraceae bacterium]HNM06861.1 XRE family transcriptional regulator [Leptospiraceae bacterium]